MTDRVFVAMRWGANQTCDEIFRSTNDEYVLIWKDENNERIRDEFIPAKRVIYYTAAENEEVDESSDSRD